MAAENFNTPVSRNWSRENIAWLAGLIEGEGCFYIQPNPSGSSLIKVCMTDEDVILKAQRIAGCGQVSGPRMHMGGRKPAWTWTLARAKHVLAISYAIYPFMGERRTLKLKQLIDRILSMKKTLHERNHGTRSRYCIGCRCEECSRAAAVYRKARGHK